MKSMAKSVASQFLFGVLVILGCNGVHLYASDKYQLSISSTIPAAEGVVYIEQGSKTSNTEVKIKIQHLSLPENLTGPENTYVVWVRPSNGSGTAQNIGALTLDKDLDGTLKTVVPFKKFDLFITPEASSVVSEPSGQHLLWTSITLK